MKRLKSMDFLSIMLTLLALAFGADISMAAAATVGQDVPQSQAADVDSKGTEHPEIADQHKTDLTGTPGTEKQVKDSDNNDDEIDDAVAKFQPFKFPFTTYIEREARQKRVTDYEIKHGVLAPPLMECTLKAQITASNSTDKYQLTIGNSSNHISDRDQRMFGRSQTFVVKGVPGYEWNGTQNIEKGMLELKVLGRSETHILVTPVNGYYVSGVGYTIKDNIAAGKTLLMMATAGHTAQLVVSPKNQTPTFVKATLQKKIMNTMLEKEWAKKKKQIPFFIDDVADNALMTFRQENERTKLLGASGVLVENDAQLGDVNCYFEEGVIPQLLMKFGVNDMTFAALIALTRMQFTKWSANNEAYFFVGSELLSDMLNLDFTKVAQVNILANTDKYGIDITEFKSSFGKLKIVLLPSLDDIDMADCGFIVDMKNAVHYWKQPNVSEKSTDHLANGGDNPIEADRDRYIKIDCFCLRGYNSILVGPTEKIYNIETVYDNRGDIYTFNKKVGDVYYTLSKLSSNGNGQAAATPKMWVGGGETTDPYDSPTGWTDGMLVYLESDDNNTGGTGFTAGTIAKWDATTETWSKYSGQITA